MRHLLLILCLLSYLYCVYCEVKDISVHILKNNNCKVHNLYRFKIGDTAKVTIYDGNKTATVNISISRLSDSNYPRTGENINSINVPLTCTNVRDDWTINVDYQNKWHTCETKVEIESEENFLNISLLSWIIIAFLFIIIVAETCGLYCLIRKVKKLREPGREKCIEDRPETPLSEDRYIKDPVQRKKKLIKNDTDSDIYDIPDIKIGVDQGTLKSNISIAERPPMPIPDEDVYLEPGEVLNNLPPPTIDTSERSKSNRKPKVIQEKQMKTFPVTKEHEKSKLTPAMTRRFENNQPQCSLGRSRDPLPDPPGPVRNIEPSPKMSRKPEPNLTLGRNRELPKESPVPARKFELKSTLGRSRDPLPDPPGQALNNEPKSTFGRRRPLPEPPGIQRNIEPQSSLGRSRDPLPDPPGPVRNIGVQMPSAQYPTPGPFKLKKPLKSAVQIPIMPVPGPDILKKPLKPVPPPNRPKPQPPKEHNAPFSNILIPPPAEVPLPTRRLPPTVGVPTPIVPTSTSLDEQVEIFNKQRELEEFPIPTDDDEWETYEPLDPINLYSV